MLQLKYNICTVFPMHWSCSYSPCLLFPNAKCYAKPSLSSSISNMSSLYICRLVWCSFVRLPFKHTLNLCSLSGIAHQTRTRKLTSNAVWTKKVRLLHVSTSRALVQSCHILHSLSCHLSMSLLHVWSLFLRHSSQYRFPYPFKQTRNIELYGRGDRKCQRR